MRIFRIEKVYLNAYPEKLTQTFISSCSLQRQPHALIAEAFLRGKQIKDWLQGAAEILPTLSFFSQNCGFFFFHSFKYAST